jgi:N-acetylmuramoyl-L-alanine amidase
MGRPFRLSLLFAVAFVCLCQTAPAASDWQVIKVGNRDYLSVENIAKFYELFSAADPVAKKIRLANGQNELEVKLASREIIINGVRNWLSFPVIEKDGIYLISRVDLAKTLEPQLRPQMIQNLGKVRTVVLDPGHGGHEKGATNRYGFEKNFTLDVARQLRPLLQAKGFKVILTRENDVFVPLQVRARIANAAKDSIFVSIHFNAAGWNPAATGFEIFSLTPIGAPSTDDDDMKLSFINRQAGSPVDAASIGLSTSIYHSLIGQIPEFDRGIKRARFAVLRLTKVPAVLVEGGFLTERAEARLIANKEWRGKLAQAISTGIVNYRDLVDKKQRPMLLADYRRQTSGELAAPKTNILPAINPSPTPAVIPASN